MNVQEENFTFECSTVPKIGDVKDAVTTSDQGCFVIQNIAEMTAKFNDALNQENLAYHNEKTNMGVNILVPSSGVLRFVGWKDKLKPSENVEWYKCALCELKTDDKDVFLRHFKIIHEEKRFFHCKFGKYKCKNERGLQAHIKLIHNENIIKQYNCPNCGLKTNDKDLYSGHFEIIHGEEELFQCEFCDYKSKSKHSLQAHIDLKHNERTIKLYNCLNCDLKTNYKDVFLRHFEIVHVEKEKWFQCVFCEYKSIFRGHLNDHVKHKHSVEQKKIEQMTTQPTDTQNQRMTDVVKRGESGDSKSVTSENNIKPSENVSWYICDLCELKTKYKDVFLRHFKIIHEEKRFFHCKFCKYKSKDECSLQTHIDSKHNVKPYKCPYCDFKTNYKYSLLQHFEVIHKKKEKCFQCAFCEYKSKFKGNVQRHIKKKHKKVESVTARLHDYHDRIVHDNNPTGYKATHLKLEDNVIKDNVNSDDIKREIEGNDIVIHIENLRSAMFKSDLETCEDVKYEYKLCELKTKCRETEIAEDIRIDIKEEEIECSEVIKIEVKEEDASPSSSLDEVCFDTQNNEYMVTSFNNILNPGNCGNDKEYNVTDAITCEKM